MGMGFYRDLALDLGTATVQGAEKGKGIVLREPNVAAVDRTTGQLLAVGQAARELLDRTPGTLTARYPLVKGVIADGGLTTEMLVDRGVANNLNTACVTLTRWLKDGLVSKMPDGKSYRKTFKEIPV
jgi:actin-like ATPase involved in cell morphogenesis